MKTDKAIFILRDFKENGIPLEAKNKRFNLTLEFQDIIGQSKLNEIPEFYKSLNQEDRKNFLWVIFHTLSQDTALDILRQTVIREYRLKLEEEHAKEEIRLSDDYRKTHELLGGRKRIFEECKKPIFKKIRKLELEKKIIQIRAEGLKEENIRLMKVLTEIKNYRNSLRIDAEKFRDIKELLSD